MARSCAVLRRLWPLLTALLLSPVAPTSARAGLVFQFEEGPGLIALSISEPTLYGHVIQGFTDAAAIWQNVLHDDVVLKFEIDFDALDPGVIGQASSTMYVGTYEELRDAMRADAQTSVDQTATNALPNTPSLVFRTNQRNGDPHIDDDVDDPGDDDDFINNTFILISGANVRALGIMPAEFADNTDASITFSSEFSFDFDRSNGIDGGAVDFIGVAAHEIGHALGFTSGIDFVDFFTGDGDGALVDLNGPEEGIGTIDSEYYFTVLDLFRSSNSSEVSPGIYDWTTGGSPGLTVDGGNTIGPLFSTGVENGDGNQASHWKDNLGLGIMDPTLGFGELAVLSANDLLALDVLGWDLQAVPEPSSLMLCSSAAVAWLVRRRRSQRTSSTAIEVEA